MFKLIALALAPLAGCALPVVAKPAPAGPPPKPACEAGAEIVVWGDDATPCDLDGSNTLTVLGIPESECDHIGGHFEYEACVDADF